MAGEQQLASAGAGIDPAHPPSPPTGESSPSGGRWKNIQIVQHLQYIFPFGESKEGMICRTRSSPGVEEGESPEYFGVTGWRTGEPPP